MSYDISLHDPVTREGLCAALAELAWSECDRVAYGTGEEG